MRYFFCFGFLLFIPRVIAQENGTDNVNVDNPSYWIGLGFGTCYFGPTFHASASFSYNENILTLRYLKANEFQISFGEAYDFDDPPLSLKEIGILYGRSFRKEYLLFSLSGGISVLSGTERGKQIKYKEYERISMAAFGVPFEAEFRIEITNSVGIGGSLFGNVNSKKTFTGGMAKITIGKFL